jgi:hypothetical protein
VVGASGRAVGAEVVGEWWAPRNSGSNSEPESSVPGAVVSHALAPKQPCVSACKTRM